MKDRNCYSSWSSANCYRKEHWFILNVFNVLLLKYKLKVKMPFLQFSFMTNYCISGNWISKSGCLAMNHQIGLLIWSSLLQNQTLKWITSKQLKRRVFSIEQQPSECSYWPYILLITQSAWWNLKTIFHSPFLFSKCWAHASGPSSFFFWMESDDLTQRSISQGTFG